MKKDKGWFKLKKYPHIGLPITFGDRQWVHSYVNNPKLISEHSFYPFIHVELSTRKYRRSKLANGKRSLVREVSYKTRDIFYANHLDSLIYSYYAWRLERLYEKQLSKSTFNECITAYRQIPLLKTPSRNKCNIDFANDVFNYITNNRHRELVVITFDISSFFDNLDHSYLKERWEKTLDCKGLPDDHYAVYRNLTKFSYVHIDDLHNEFKKEIIVKDKMNGVKRKAIKRLDLLKAKDAIAFCTKEEFGERIRAKGLIRNNKRIDNGARLRTKGIPQGSPLSALLANIYMFEFDGAIYDAIASINGIYRRYSDDMIAIADLQHLENIVQLFRAEIDKVKLDIQPTKTQIFVFKRFEGKYGCQEYDPSSETFNSKAKFEYLGFSFDGESVLLKNSALAKFYRKMKRNVRRGGFFAKHGKNQEPELFKARLYKRFTHVGSKRRTIFVRDKKNPDKWIKSNKYDWGNFLSYTGLAIRIFPKSKIKSQTKRHWKILHQLMKEKQQEINAHYGHI